MRACEQTAQMLSWWLEAGIAYVDLAVRRPGGAMLWHREMEIGHVPLSWSRAENVRGADIYIRPSRSRSWPLLFLDDVTPEMTRRVMRHYAALAISTSLEGGCHLWLRVRRSLDEQERAQAQRWLAAKIGADPASTSGEHLGRLAGFKNWKRGGSWVNVAEVASPEKRPWTPVLIQSLRRSVPTQNLMSARKASSTTGRDTSPSGREWAWTCWMVERGVDSSEIFTSLLQRAALRRGPDAARYARRTVDQALQINRARRSTSSNSVDSTRW